MTNITIVDVNVDFSNALIDFKSVSAAQSSIVWPWSLNTTTAVETEELVILLLA